MCGIIGCISKDGSAARNVYDGLLRLEYRGYDSAGISALGEKGMVTVKRSGRVEKLARHVPTLYGRVAIGHTRWATHGAPTDSNAHPHTCGAFSVVHNGIIENYAELRAELAEGGHVFSSQTDSEVVVHLIAQNYTGDPVKAVAAAVKRLKGSFALAVLCIGFDGFIAVRFKSSLVVGSCAQGVFAASDIPALPDCAEEVTVMEDGDIAVIDGGGVRFYDFDLNAVTRQACRIVRSQFSASTGEYPHFMLKEIHQSVRTVRDTADSFLRSVDVARLKGLLDGAERIILTGCGTAYNACLLAARFLGERVSAEICVVVASELRYYPPAARKNTLVIAVSQSGETADTLGALYRLAEEGAKVVAVTNCGYSAITRAAHMVLPVCAGAELCVAATKSYLGQLAALYLLANIADSVRAAGALERVAECIPAILSAGEECETFSALCASSSAVFFLGRGADYDAAVEASLKLKEVTYIFSDAYPAGELKHGTLALVDESTLSIFIICSQPTAEKCITAVHEVLCRGGRACIVTDIAGLGDDLVGVPVWRIPPSGEGLAPMLAAVAMQLVAYFTAVRRGTDPDKPRNLAKSVTVE